MRQFPTTAGTVPKETVEGLRRTGVVVIRGVTPEKEAEALLSDVHVWGSSMLISSIGS